jgi:hypothetical protein
MSRNNQNHQAQNRQFRSGPVEIHVTHTNTKEASNDESMTTGKTRGFLFETLRKTVDGKVTLEHGKVIIGAAKQLNNNLLIEMRLREQQIRANMVPDMIGSMPVN